MLASDLGDCALWGAFIALTVAALIFAPAAVRSAWIWWKRPCALSWRDAPLALVAVAFCIIAYGFAGYVTIRDFVRGR